MEFSGAYSQVTVITSSAKVLCTQRRKLIEGGLTRHPDITCMTVWGARGQSWTPSEHGVGPASSKKYWGAETALPSRSWCVLYVCILPWEWAPWLSINSHNMCQKIFCHLTKHSIVTFHIMPRSNIWASIQNSLLFHSAPFKTWEMKSIESLWPGILTQHLYTTYLRKTTNPLLQ